MDRTPRVSSGDAEPPPGPRTAPVPWSRLTRRRPEPGPAKSFDDAPPEPERVRIPLETGARIPGTPYRLVRWLGDGGMGAVFEATHVDIERRVAIKLLHPHGGLKDWVREGFRNEARISARIGFPNIVDIYDFKELPDGRCLIAMEFLDGPTLREVIERQSLTWPQIIGITRQICRGLAAAHDAGVVHRDVKPENIMLVPRDGRRDFVKLLDFGVAQVMRELPRGGPVGTAEYMAPEAIRGVGDLRVDVYAVGCLLFEMLTRQPPFDGDSPEAILRRQLEQEPEAPSAVASARNIPAGLDAITLRCLAKSPKQRYATMVELEAALCELQIERNWTTTWDDLPAPSVDPERRDRIESGLRALAARRPSRSRRRRWGLAALGVAFAGAAALGWSRWGAPPSDAAAVNDPLDAHARAARDAAARFYFVYPPKDDPDGSTAYREVYALEREGSEAARQRGAALRQEFAATLVRLGDRYWDFEGARPFAYEYYASALVFASHPRALSRTSLTPAGLERLRHRAITGDFSEHELLATELLVALAEPDAERRSSQLVSMREQPHSLSVLSSLDRVVERDQRRVAAASADAPAAAFASASAPASTPSLPDVADPPPLPDDAAASPPDAPSSPATPAPDEEPSSPAPSTDSIQPLLQQAARAHRTGQLKGARALYNRALAADHRSLPALDGLAKIAFSEARYDDAVELLERAVRFGSGSGRRWLSLGDAYFKTLRYAQATDAYREARERGSTAATGRLEKVERRLGRR